MNDIIKEKLNKEIVTPVTLGVQRESSHPSIGLNPVRLARLLRGAEEGDAISYLELAEDMEEKDLHYAGVLTTRKRAIAQMDISVVAAGDDKDSQRDADLIRAWLDRDVLQLELMDILDAIGKAYSVCEIIWNTERSPWMPRAIKWRDPKFFGINEDGETLHLIGKGNEKIALAPYKFVIHKSTYKSGDLIRCGLARPIAWYFMFKNFTIKDWIIFMEKYGHPLLAGKYENADEKQIQILLKALQGLGTDKVAAFPRSMEIEPMQLNSGSTDMYERFARWAEEKTSILVLGQNLTTEVKGGSLAAAQVHNQVKDEIVLSDGVSLAATLNRDLVRPMVDLNFGKRAAYPKIKIQLRDKTSPKETLETVSAFVALGGEVEMSVIRDKIGLPDPAPGAKLLHALKQESSRTEVTAREEKLEAERPELEQDEIEKAVAEAIQSDGYDLISEEQIEALSAQLGAAKSQKEAQGILSRFFLGLNQESVINAMAQLSFSARASAAAGFTLSKAEDKKL